jgi:CRISPR-associated protein Cas1
MRQHLNTLYVTTDGAYVHKEGENIVVQVDGAERMRVPVHLLGGFVAFGRINISPPLMGFCAEKGVTITHLSENGRFLARVEGPISGNVLLRRAQYRAADDPVRSTEVVRAIVIAKTLNQRNVVRRAVRDHGTEMAEAPRTELETTEIRLTDIARRSERSQSLDALRGLEGEAAAAYFGVFDHLLLTNEPALRFTGRSRRPPLDAVNALLSFLYTILVHDCRSALETVGLDPAAGFLHSLRPGRPSLALDLVEEFRPNLADRLAVSLINRNQIDAAAFRHMNNGAVLLGEQARKMVLVAWQDRKRDELMHPFLEEKTTMGLLPHLQAQLLARFLRGDLDGYPPMIWK